ncbi:hypothetical protein L228DRAFT_269356 [Xylona heveae TC161]|uniref:HRDC domain-containing protein n=1 Tax=Xylona heveae (strain CBS 132557 / TC161) TaxID=1328760 RepID=A0A165G9K4_XYLHT|nr:hypothetical protein L228DRAFT_269356 [Xylona heveae TC161]KZF21908.1 hypothetical protein L228DRAFT_269356 [Xylona heveae TC161]
MDPAQNFRSLQEQVSSALVATTRTTGQIAAEDLPFQRSLDANIASSLDEQKSRFLKLAEKLVNFAASGSEIDAPQLEDADALENNWRGVVDVIDSLLERADTCLDEYTGVIKRLSPSEQERPPTPKPKKARTGNVFRTQNIPKPQLLFENVPTNAESTAFKPLLNAKPHAIVPLEQSLTTFVNEYGLEQYKHPYEAEIKECQYPPSVYDQVEPIPYRSFEDTAATFVDTPEAVAAMLAELKNAKEIAIDLEHHDSRSYVGIVSLMQISTRDKDWVVDTLKPWRRDLQVLNEVFADPRIVKVFHGSFMDMIWLQRDLGLYVVGLFDTYHAARALGFPKQSLAYLLSKYVGFDADKQYQMADWRIRPLPEEMFNYARSDTHFLLYIYDCLRNELIEKTRRKELEQHCIQDVLQRSKDYALQRYERPIYDEINGRGPGGWYDMLVRSPAMFSKEQFAVFKAVHQWRDQVARQNDDSTNYIMPKHVLLNIAKAMPMEVPALLNVAQPISQPVRLRISELLGVIKQAKAAGANGPDMMQVLQPQQPASQGGEAPEDGKSVNTFGGETALSERKLPATPFPIKSDSSTFWGETFGSSVWQVNVTPGNVIEDLRLALPLPELTAEIFANPSDFAASRPNKEGVDPGARAEHEYIKDRKPQASEDSNIFVVKQLGGGRKRKFEDEETHVPTSGPTSDTSEADVGTQEKEEENAEEEEEEIRLPTEEDEIKRRAQEKAARKAEKKAKKKEEKELAKQQAQAAQDAEMEAEPFDYSKAESVLHANPQGKGAIDKSKRFNPYAKAANAPKGMRKVQKEKSGKSFTFRK